MKTDVIDQCYDETTGDTSLIGQWCVDFCNWWFWMRWPTTDWSVRYVIIGLLPSLRIRDYWSTQCVERINWSSADDGNSLAWYHGYWWLPWMKIINVASNAYHGNGTVLTDRHSTIMMGKEQSEMWLNCPVCGWFQVFARFAQTHKKLEHGGPNRRDGQIFIGAGGILRIYRKTSLSCWSL